MNLTHFRASSGIAAFLAGVLVTTGSAAAGTANGNGELMARVQIAAASLEDAVIVDCQLPGKLQRLGGTRTYLTPGQLTRLSAIECRTRGGEYTMGDLASGTFSLKRWLPLAEQGNVEAQYYVARIYANGMGDVPLDYAKAVEWYRKAAAQKYSSALQELGFMYERGLGVEKDELLALNLQRQASGLGQNLDYASKIVATREEAARQVAALSTQLEDANLELDGLRLRLQASDDQLIRGRAQQAATEDRILTLRRQLEAAKQSTDAASLARAEQLQRQLAERDSELQGVRQQVAAQTVDLQTLKAQLVSGISSSQTANARLNQLLVTKQAENQVLAARLAQSEARLLQTQQELSESRRQFAEDAGQLASEREQLETLQVQTRDSGAALLASRQRDMERLKLQIDAQNAELERLRRGMSIAGAEATAAKARSAELVRELTAQQDRYNALQRETKALGSRSQSEQATAIQQLNQQLAMRAADLDRKRLTIDSLQKETERQRAELATLRSQGDSVVAAVRNEASAKSLELKVAQQKLASMRESLEQLQTASAADRLALSQERDQLREKLGATQNRSQRDLAVLQASIQEKESTIAIKNQRIVDLQQQLAGAGSSLSASNITYRMPATTTVRSNEGTNLIKLVRSLGTARYHALVIGNNEYQHVGKLTTPVADAESVAEVLEQRYGFTVKRMFNATYAEMLKALWDYSQRLTDEDRLLIYYAGHGGTSDGPPDRAYWWGVDADPNVAVGWIPAEQIRAQIKQMQARQVLLVSDSCFSSALTNAKSTTVVSNSSETTVRIQWNKRASLVLTSGQNTPVVDTTGDRRHSLFATYFLRVLRQNETLLSGANLAAEVASQMLPEEQRLGLKQTPTYTTLMDANHNFGEFFFVPTSSTSTLVAAVAR